METVIALAQKELRKEQLDGWLLYDFRGSNDLAWEVLKIPPQAHLTRRLFYWIPQQGQPIKILHQIEPHALQYLPGKERLYRSWQELEKHLQSLLKNKETIAMEYSPGGAIPYVSKVDAGTMDLIRSFGVQVVSSANLLQSFTCVWNEDQRQSHFYAARVLDTTVRKAWKWISQALEEGREISEYDVQQEMLREFGRQDCETDSGPIVAVNAHSADPHYVPTQSQHAPIRPGDFLLIDLWCRKKSTGATFADICRVAVVGSQPTKKQEEIFQLVKKARDAATNLVKSAFAAGEELMGWEVDRCARDVIEKAGYGQYFTHRTGHNIHTTTHGAGAHIDDFETQDRRRLIPGTCFSIEPGIYLPNEFGVRLEYDLVIHPNGQVEISGGEQVEIELLDVKKSEVV